MASVSTLSFLKLRLYTKSRLFNVKFFFGHKILFLKSRLYVKSRFIKSRLYCSVLHMEQQANNGWGGKLRDKKSPFLAVREAFFTAFPLKGVLQKRKPFFSMPLGLSVCVFVCLSVRLFVGRPEASQTKVRIGHSLVDGWKFCLTFDGCIGWMDLKWGGGKKATEPRDKMGAKEELLL